MKEIKIENYIEVNGKDVPMEELTEEERQKIAETIQDTMMFTMGYVRKVG